MNKKMFLFDSYDGQANKTIKRAVNIDCITYIEAVTHDSPNKTRIRLNTNDNLYAVSNVESIADRINEFCMSVGMEK